MSEGRCYFSPPTTATDYCGATKRRKANRVRRGDFVFFPGGPSACRNRGSSPASEGIVLFLTQAQQCAMADATGKRQMGIDPDKLVKVISEPTAIGIIAITVE